MANTEAKIHRLRAITKLRYCESKDEFVGRVRYLRNKFQSGKQKMVLTKGQNPYKKDLITMQKIIEKVMDTESGEPQNMQVISFSVREYIRCADESEITEFAEFLHDCVSGEKMSTLQLSQVASKAEIGTQETSNQCEAKPVQSKKCKQKIEKISVEMKLSDTAATNKSKKRITTVSKSADSDNVTTADTVEETIESVVAASFTSTSSRNEYDKVYEKPKLLPFPNKTVKGLYRYINNDDKNISRAAESFHLDFENAIKQFKYFETIKSAIEPVLFRSLGRNYDASKVRPKHQHKKSPDYNFCFDYGKYRGFKDLSVFSKSEKEGIVLTYKCYHKERNTQMTKARRARENLQKFMTPELLSLMNQDIGWKSFEPNNKQANNPIYNTSQALKIIDNKYENYICQYAFSNSKKVFLARGCCMRSSNLLSHKFRNKSFSWSIPCGWMLYDENLKELYFSSKKLFPNFWMDKELLPSVLASYGVINRDIPSEDITFEEHSKVYNEYIQNTSDKQIEEKFVLSQMRYDFPQFFEWSKEQVEKHGIKYKPKKGERFVLYPSKGSLSFYGELLDACHGYFPHFQCLRPSQRDSVYHDESRDPFDENQRLHTGCLSNSCGRSFCCAPCIFLECDLVDYDTYKIIFKTGLPDDIQKKCAISDIAKEGRKQHGSDYDNKNGYKIGKPNGYVASVLNKYYSEKNCKKPYKALIIRDILKLGPYNLTQLPFSARSEILENVVQLNKLHVGLVPALNLNVCDNSAFLREMHDITQYGHNGIIFKHKDSKYFSDDVSTFVVSDVCRAYLGVIGIDAYVVNQESNAWCITAIHLGVGKAKADYVWNKTTKKEAISEDDYNEIVQEVGILQPTTYMNLNFEQLTQGMKQKSNRVSQQGELCVKWLSEKSPTFCYENVNDLLSATVWKVCGRTGIKDNQPVMNDIEYISETFKILFLDTYSTFCKLFPDFK